MKKRKTKNQFKKGQSGNIFGRPKMSDTEKKLALSTRSQIKNMINKYLVTNKEDLIKLKQRKDLPAIDGMLIQSILNSLDSGDQGEINWFFNLTVGKEKDQQHLHLTGGLENTESINLKKLSKEELLLLKDLAKKNET